MSKYPIIDALFEYFLKNEKRFLKKYGPKYLVIKNNRVIGTYDKDSDAYINTVKRHELGTFIIQAIPHQVHYYPNLGLFY